METLEDQKAEMQKEFILWSGEEQQVAYDSFEDAQTDSNYKGLDFWEYLLKIKTED